MISPFNQARAFLFKFVWCTNDGEKPVESTISQSFRTFMHNFAPTTLCRPLFSADSQAINPEIPGSRLERRANIRDDLLVYNLRFSNVSTGYYPLNKIRPAPVSVLIQTFSILNRVLGVLGSGWSPRQLRILFSTQQLRSHYKKFDATGAIESG